jgi:hypothetical protein
MLKRRGKVAHLGGYLAKHYGRMTMFCGLPALEKSKVVLMPLESVVTLDYVVLVGKSW